VLLVPAAAGWPAGGDPPPADLVGLDAAGPLFSPLSLLVLGPPPLLAGLRRRPPADGRPSGVGGGEPQRGWAPGAAPEARAAVSGPHPAAVGAGCGCGRVLGRR
jgi:hypothetical protein